MVNGRRPKRGVGKKFPHAFGVTVSGANAIGAEPLWGAKRLVGGPNPSGPSFLNSRAIGSVG